MQVLEGWKPTEGIQFFKSTY